MQSSIQRSRTTATTNSQVNSGVRAEMTWQFLDFTRQPTINSVSKLLAQRYASMYFLETWSIKYKQLLPVISAKIGHSYTIIAQSQRNSAKFVWQGSKQGASVSRIWGKVTQHITTLFRDSSSKPITSYPAHSRGLFLSRWDVHYCRRSKQVSSRVARWPRWINSAGAAQQRSSTPGYWTSKGSKWSDLTIQYSAKLYLSANAVTRQAIVRPQQSDILSNSNSTLKTTMNKLVDQRFKLWHCSIDWISMEFLSGWCQQRNADFEFNRSKSFEFQAEAARDLATDTVKRQSMLWFLNPWIHNCWSSSRFIQNCISQR